MANENGTQSLEAASAIDPGPGAPAGEPQPEPTAAVEPTGAEPQKPRTYSQDEFGKLQSALDKQGAAKDEEIAGLKQALTDATRKGAVEKAQLVEQQALESDRLELDNNDIDSKEFVKRQTVRQQMRVKEEETAQTAAVQGDREALAIKAGRVVAALHYATEHEVDLNTLMNDESLTTPKEMELRARELRIEKDQAEKTGTETFASVRTTPSANGVSSYIKKVKDGDTLPSSAEIDQDTKAWIAAQN